MVQDNIDEIKEILKEIFDMTIDYEKYVADYSQAKWIMVSSLLFMIPCVYSFVNELYFISASLLISTVLSINFWRHATYSWRRISDRIYAKFSFIFFLIYGIKYVTCLPLIIIGYIGLFGLIYCFYMSNKICKGCNTNIMDQDPAWLKYHMSFHLITVCTQMMIIKCIIDCRKSGKE